MFTIPSGSYHRRKYVKNIYNQDMLVQHSIKGEKERFILEGLGLNVFSQNNPCSIVTPCEGSWQKQLRALPCNKLPNLLIWGLIYGSGNRNPRRLREILYLDSFLRPPFTVIRVIATVLFATENPGSVTVFVLVCPYSQSSA